MFGRKSYASVMSQFESVERDLLEVADRNNNNAARLFALKKQLQVRMDRIYKLVNDRITARKEEAKRAGLAAKKIRDTLLA